MVRESVNACSVSNVRKVGVLSDTHASTLDELPTALRGLIGSVDLIIHAGDYTGKGLLDELQNSGIPFHGVYGNLDGLAIRNSLPGEELIELERLRIGITHPSEGGPPEGIERRIRAKFLETDVLIYGHTHFAMNEVRDGILYLNPGSATGKYPAPYPSIAILEMYPEMRAVIHRA